MSKSAVFLPKVADRAAILSNTHHLDSSDVANGVSSGDAELQETDDNGAPSSREAPINGARSGADATPFQQLEAMFALWQSSGKSISLWDWLEGFRHALDGGDSKSSKPNGKRESSSESQEPGKRKREDDDEEAEEAVDEEEEARQHARFIRFVEESRMMGLVRARAKGPGKRGEEVAKGVLMI